MLNDLAEATKASDGKKLQVECCKEAYDIFSPSHTDAALPLGSGAYSIDLLKRQAQYFKSLSRGRRSALAANNAVADTIFQK